MFPVSKTIDTAQERYLKRLSPELQEKIRKLEQIPLLPEWPDKTRGAPNICLRSALFGVIKRGQRRALKGEVIATIKGLDIRYTGWQLDQGDFDVLVQSLHLQTRYLERTPNNFIRFRIKTFLRDIGRHPGKSGKEWLKDCFRRLTATAIEINICFPHGRTNQLFTYAGSLIDEFYYNDKEQTYFLKINPKLAELFDAGWTQLQWQQRLQLTSDLAKWLHGFYSSHRIPYPMKVATLKILCGSSCKRLVDFRRILRMAMDELIRVESLENWKIDNTDKMHVQKNTTKTITE
ncbi:MAG: replication initiator protein A [Proteobacteria bacterium]|nr:replication initiator protein A [Pseudomonadota bacterium]